MGVLMAKLSEPLQQCSGSVADLLSGRRKRKRSTDAGTLAEDELNKDSQSPKKKKLLTTTQYIYQTLFKEQKNCDISVMAMGKVWHLHKVYLCQSPYFYSMFNGSWRESSQDFVHIKILDEKITLDALDSVFGAMYCDEIEIDAKGVIAVLATATLFHLESIIEKCCEVMIETVNAETAVTYYEAAVQYGCLNAKKVAFTWLELNLLCVFSKHHKLLRQINVDLMTQLVASPDLYVMQTEFSLYTLLRTWMFLRLHPNYDMEHVRKMQLYNEGSEIEAAYFNLTHSYFCDRKNSIFFLGTTKGQHFLKPFQKLRTQYLANHHMDLKIVLNDNIIPKEWMESHVLSQWNAVLRVDHMPEDGPQDLDAEVFLKNCMRCGRILMEPGYQKWRWTGFNFGLDLILIADSRVLSLRRHHRNEHERLLSLQTKRQFMIRASVTSINSQRQSVFTQKSEITSLSLEKNEEVTLMVMDAKLVHPLLISVNLLAVPPTSQDFKENILATSEENNSVPISEIGANCGRSVTPTSESDDSAVCVVAPPSPPYSPVPLPDRVNAETLSITSTLSAESAASSSTDFM